MIGCISEKGAIEDADVCRGAACRQSRHAAPRRNTAWSNALLHTGQHVPSRRLRCTDPASPPPPPNLQALPVFVATSKTILMHLSCRRGSGTIHPTPYDHHHHYFWGESVGRKSRLTALRNGQAVPSTLPPPPSSRMSQRATLEGGGLKPSMPQTPLSPRLISN